MTIVKNDDQQWRKKRNLSKSSQNSWLGLSFCICVFLFVFVCVLWFVFDVKWWQMMTKNEEKKKPVQISPEQLVGLVGEGHFAIRDSCRKHCQDINIWEWNEILSKNVMWYIYHPHCQDIIIWEWNKIHIHSLKSISQNITYDIYIIYISSTCGHKSQFLPVEVWQSTPCLVRAADHRCDKLTTPEC